MRSLSAAVMLAAAACNPPGNPEKPRQSASSLALSTDDTYLYAVDADAELLAVIDTRTEEKVAEVKVGGGAHLVAVGSDDLIWVANRYGAGVSVIRRGEWKEAARYRGIPEPVGLAISSDAKTVYVVSAIAEDTPVHGALYALDASNGDLRWTVPLGEEPRSIALLDDGHAVVTLLKQGDVQYVDLERPAVTVAKTDTFERMNKTVLEQQKTFPEAGVDVQHARALGAVAVSADGKQVHALGITARQGAAVVWGGGCTGTLLAAPAMFSYDTNGGSFADDVFQCNSGGSPAPPTVMVPPGQRQFFAQSAGANHLQGPSAIALERTGRWMYVANQQTNNVAIVSTANDDLEASNVKLVVKVGRGPNGVAVRTDGTRVYVLNAFDHTVSVLADDGRRGVAAVREVRIAGETLPADVVRGRLLFFDATDPRMTGGGLGAACATCHLDNGREDGHVWTFAEGKRQTMSLAGGRLKGTEPFHWDGRLIDMNHLMNDTTTARMGGQGTDEAMAADVLAFLNSVPAPLNPKQGRPLTEAQVRGQAVYQRAECGTCHGGASLTNNTYAHVGTDESNLKHSGVVAFPNGGVNVPSLLGISRTAPYLHDGSVSTLYERIMSGKLGDAHGKTSALSDDDVRDLVDYMETL